MKNLPIGIQAFSELIRRNCIYVDKTPLIHQLTTTGKYYFLSRPRRFGKSLLVSTMKELYAGNKALFEGLWIESNWDWSKKNPVLHFSFDTMGYVEDGLLPILKIDMQSKAALFDVEIEKTDLKGMFQELIEKVSEKYGKVVLLVDEYDKPILDYLETSTMSSAKENRDILREFYGVLKNADGQLELVFITGISKFSKVSIFSHLNNLDDITLNKKYATLTGYTKEELTEYFGEHLEDTAQNLGVSKDKLLQEMAIWYNGYSWDGVHRVYNPFGTLMFFTNQRFQNFWFATGSPRFLIDQMKRLEVFNIENINVNNATLDKFDLDNIELVPLLFQTGYLTVKSLDVWTGDMVLDYPNKEVRETMYQFLIDEIARNPHRTHTGMTIKDLSKAFNANDLENVREIINSLLADLPAETFQKQTEGLYHGLVHLVFSYLGVMIQSEVHSSKGRADAIVQTANEIYIFEFKFNKTAQEAIEQINKKGYASRYTTSGKKIRGIGVNFNSATRQIDDWAEVDLS
jgi:Predicted AAA-ATPase/PD-(D/E)XK nuclease superfamily